MNTILPRTGAIAALLVLAACAKGQDAKIPDNVATENFAVEAADQEAEAANATSAPLPTDAWVGKWIGVEGLVLDIQKAGEPGRYVLGITLLDGTKSYEGSVDGDVIRFTRDGRPESVRAATGDETGLKWLAGKQNCLMIQQGEGFCRDEAPATGVPATAPAAATPATPGA
jgi:hypothetical protein